MKIIKELAKFNNIKFYHDKHIYYLNGTKTKSVTSIISEYKHPFDKEYWSQKKADESRENQNKSRINWKRCMPITGTAPDLASDRK